MKSPLPTPLEQKEKKIASLANFIKVILEDYELKRTLNEVLKSWGEKEQPFIQEYAEQLYDLIMGIVEIELKKKETK